MTYEQRNVYIVKDNKDGTIYKVFGIKSEAEDYKKRCVNPSMVIDIWPVEFEVEEKKEE
jgi:hypothetical protein